MGTLATIIEVDAKLHRELGAPMSVDFNPTTLRLTHTTTGPGATQGSTGTAVETTAVARQQTNYATALSMDLLFDTSRDGSDVRAKTLVLVALTRPQGSGAAAGRTVRFAWGAFLFTGYIESLNETIDFFSPDGVPLRATIAMSLRGLAERDSRPGSVAGFGGGLSAGASFGASAGVSAGASFGASAGIAAGASFGASFGASAGVSATAAIGTTPLTFAAAGDTVQSVAARAGVSWKAVAAANAIDNPRILAPGTVLDVRASTR